MNNAIYIALSRQTGLFRNLDVAANNIANASTPGYKGETMVFEQYLANDKDNFRRKIAFSNDVATFVDYKDGAMTKTGRDLDIALDGKGFFKVETPQGERYTRRGSLTINNEGILVTQEGYPVLQSDNQVITLQPNDIDIKISANGAVRVGDTGLLRGDIHIVDFANPQKLKRLEGGLYEADASEPPEEQPENPAKVLQGYLEQSNVSPVTELTNLININRSVSGVTGFMADMHDLTRRAITAYTRSS
jgi:flagellar basal-body rod protein FlgF